MRFLFPMSQNILIFMTILWNYQLLRTANYLFEYETAPTELFLEHGLYLSTTVPLMYVCY